MNYQRILLFTICCMGSTAILSKIAEGRSLFELSVLFVIAIGAGYSYGTFQMFYVYEKQIASAIETIKKETDGK